MPKTRIDRRIDGLMKLRFASVLLGAVLTTFVLAVKDNDGAASVALAAAAFFLFWLSSTLEDEII